MYTWSCEALCIKAFSKWPVMFLVWNNNNKKWWQCWKKGLLSVVPRPRYLQMPTAETTDDAPVVCGFTTSTFPCIFPLCSCVVFFWFATSGASSHFKHHISAFIISLGAGCSPTSASSPRCQLDADLWHVGCQFESRCICPRTRSSQSICPNPSRHDTLNTNSHK